MSIEIQRITKTFGAFTALKDVSLHVPSGELVALLGPSGSGKTTLLAMIGGLLAPTAGAILVNGRDIARLSKGEQSRYRRESVGYVFQANNLLPFLTARENLEVIGAISRGRGAEVRARAGQLLEELGMTRRADALATALSGGERQRVAIGRALMNQPEMVLVDEPTANLDSARGAQVVASLIAEVRGRGLLGIMVTHDVAMAKLADRVLELHDGVLSGGG